LSDSSLQKLKDALEKKMAMRLPSNLVCLDSFRGLCCLQPQYVSRQVYK
jgi:hypothetical protein